MGQSLKFFLIIQFMLLVSDARAQGVDDCVPKCSAFNENIQHISNAIHAAKPAPLSKKEEKAIKDATEETVDKIIEKQSGVYREQFRNESRCRIHYGLIFGKNFDDQQFYRNMASVQSFDTDINVARNQNKRLAASAFPSNCLDPSTSNVSYCILQRECLGSMWSTDRNLQNISAEVRKYSDDNKRDEKRREDAFNDAAKKSIKAREPQIEAYIGQAYREKREGKDDFTKKELRKLDININLQQMAANEELTVLPTSEKFSNLSMDEIVEKVRQNLENNGEPALYCKPKLATPEVIRQISEKIATSGQPKALQQPSTEKPTEELEATVPPCELKQFFDDNQASVTEASKAEIAKCLDRAKTACGGHIAKMQAMVASCADTRRTLEKDKITEELIYKSNKELAVARHKKIAAAVEAQAHLLQKMGILENKASVSRDSDEVRNTYENRDDDGNLTGTCGPRPPKNWNTEPWMHSLACSAVAKYDPNCLKNTNKSNHWKCLPDPEKVERKSKSAIYAYYQQFRRAELTINFTCAKAPKKVETKSEVKGNINPSYVPPENYLYNQLRSKIIVQCYRPKIAIVVDDNTFFQSKGGFIRRTPHDGGKPAYEKPDYGCPMSIQ